ncbi:co dehydrogenase accessory protein cooc (nickel insertion) [hydrocarbon metagenome]|uniref:Co dehydrogenase accessory protein cooc (Nickel insertion) n=1 Tax=hydrocarbon metagenome TaxID=938273 RepID=A0A0W8FP48_9ZZZZ
MEIFERTFSDIRNYIKSKKTVSFPFTGRNCDWPGGAGRNVVLIDGEAGVEQINRRVMKTVDHLIMISDTSAKGINVANTIKHLAQDNKAVNYKSMGMILNRVRNESEVKDISKNAPVNILGWLPEDDLIREFDFPDSAEACQTVDGIINALCL